MVLTLPRHFTTTSMLVDRATSQYGYRATYLSPLNIVYMSPMLSRISHSSLVLSMIDGLIDISMMFPGMLDTLITGYSPWSNISITMLLLPMVSSLDAICSSVITY